MQYKTTPPYYQWPRHVWRNSVKNYSSYSLETIFLHQSRAITLLFINEFSPFAIPNHSSLISMAMQSLKKFGQKLLKYILETTFLHQSRAITLLFINKFSSFVIQNHSSLISRARPSLKKFGQKLLKSESGNDIFTSIKGHNSVVYKRI